MYIYNYLYTGVSARLSVYRRERHLGPVLPERRHTDTLLGYDLACICV